MRRSLWAWVWLCVGYTFLTSTCQSGGRGGANPSGFLVWKSPAGFPPMLIPSDNPMTQEGIELGRRLFFDPVLSADSTISCASCHRPEYYFTDGKKVGEGIVGRLGKRSTMSLVNVGYYYSGLFWDGRSPSLEEQAFHPVRDPQEMGLDWEQAVRRLRRSPYYREQFKKAFSLRHSGQIDSLWTAKALAQFERTLVSSHAKFDSVMQGLAVFTPQEKRGWTIFFDAAPDLPVSECNHCHVDPLFTDLTFQNNGIQQALPSGNFPDDGRGSHTRNRFDLGKFRVPTLRNIMRTAPYMHDGSLATMDAVLSHYASGGHPAINLSPNVRRLELGPGDRRDLVAFLHTLTDEYFLHRPEFQNPW